jgi:uncharacterized protein YraI
MMKRIATQAAIAGTLLARSALSAVAEPAVVGARVNVRQGPGTNYGIITTLPAGATVDVAGCSGEWCNVTWNGRGGYAIARNLGMGGAPVGITSAPVVVSPGPVVVGPPVIIGPRRYWGPGFYRRGPYYYRRRWWW